jgi:hypothetical protein
MLPGNPATSARRLQHAQAVGRHLLGQRSKWEEGSSTAPPAVSIAPQRGSKLSGAPFVC